MLAITGIFTIRCVASSFRAVPVRAVWRNYSASFFDDPECCDWLQAINCQQNQTPWNGCKTVISLFSFWFSTHERRPPRTVKLVFEAAITINHSSIQLWWHWRNNAVCWQAWRWLEEANPSQLQKWHVRLKMQMSEFAKARKWCILVTLG